MEITEGLAALSTASFCAVTSPDLQNEKKVVAEVSHSTILLKEGSL